MQINKKNLEGSQDSNSRTHTRVGTRLQLGEEAKHVLVVVQPRIHRAGVGEKGGDGGHTRGVQQLHSHAHTSSGGCTDNDMKRTA